MNQRPRQFAELDSAAETVAATLAPFVQSLADTPAFNGAVLFVPDGHHTGTAGSAVVVNVPDRPAKQLAFTHRHIAGRRVDLRASSLGDMFRSPNLGYMPSRLNPRGHRVFGLSVGTAAQPEAIIQLAFDMQLAVDLPTPERLRDSFASHATDINAATHDLLAAGRGVRSISDALMLNTPTTPNAYVIMWDVADSTRLARHNYGWLRHYLNTFGGQVAHLVEQAGGRVSSHRGDGQNLVVPLPHSVDPADRAAISRFVSGVALPLVQAIEAAQAAIGQPMGIRIHLAHGLAHVETSYLGEATGVTFFELAKSLKALPPK